MRLLYVEKGTPLRVRAGEAEEFSATYVDNRDETVFYARCPEIHERIADWQEREVEVTLTFRRATYQITCIIEGRDDRLKRNGVIAMRAVTDLEEQQKRSAVRVETMFRVKIYQYSEIPGVDRAHRGKLICEMSAEDLSQGGIRLFSDHKLGAPMGTLFLIEFSLRPGSLLSLPSRVVRAQPNSVSAVYAYDYGFQFDFDDVPELQTKLILDFFAYRVQ